MTVWIGVALFLTVWATVAITVALMVGRAARLREERERVVTTNDDNESDDDHLPPRDSLP
ncbi:hypothetical protein AAFP30_16210 [Gordonia sp. CPCC 205515]|uniref:hypothetical protein n=1 Tax=Gordonia sp. CPCC 205515 TaxID=3140791 RepID=UPI003AF3C7D8